MYSVHWCVIIFCSVAYWSILSHLGFHRQSFESVINEKRLKGRDEVETGKVCDSIFLHYFQFIIPPLQSAGHSSPVAR